MKRRTFLVPLYPMDKPQVVQFMELIAEMPYKQGSPFAQLTGLGLDAAILAARTILYLQKPPTPAAVYWTNPRSNLSDVDGITLALVLGAWAMAQPAGYQQIIVYGCLTADNHIVSNAYWQQTCVALSACRSINRLLV